MLLDLFFCFFAVSLAHPFSSRNPRNQFYTHFGLAENFPWGLRVSELKALLMSCVRNITAVWSFLPFTVCKCHDSGGLCFVVFLFLPIEGVAELVSESPNSCARSSVT